MDELEKVKAQLAELQDLARDYMYVSDYPVDRDGECSLCMMVRGKHKDDCEYGVAYKALFAALPLVTGE